VTPCPLLSSLLCSLCMCPAPLFTHLLCGARVPCLAPTPHPPPLANQAPRAGAPADGDAALSFSGDVATSTPGQRHVPTNIEERGVGAPLVVLGELHVGPQQASPGRHGEILFAGVVGSAGVATSSRTAVSSGRSNDSATKPRRDPTSSAHQRHRFCGDQTC
jgi:hypothetical protein